MAYATVEDVAVRLGQPAGSLNTPQVQAILNDTSALVDAYTGLDWTDGVVPEGIRWVVCSRTIRLLNNPEGIRQETIGTYSYTLAAEAPVLLGGWTEEERAVLDRYGNVGFGRRVGSFNLGYVL